MKLAVLVVYLAALLGLGVLASRRIRDQRDYFAAGKRLGFLSAAFSARATGESAWLLLGLTGMGAAVGVQAFWVVVGEVLGVAGAWLLLAGRFKRRCDEYDAITVPDYLEARFSDHRHRLRLVAACSLVVFVTIYVSAQIDATGKAFESFLDGWSYTQGALVGYVVVLVYIVTGGFLAVVWSDVLQGSMMFLGLTLLPVVAILEAGGVGPMLDGLRAIDPTLLSWTGGQGLTPRWTLGALAFLTIGLGFLGSPQIFVRFLALRSPAEVPRGAAVAIVFTLLSDAGAVLIGMSGRYLLTTTGQDVEAVLGPEGEDVLPMLSEHLLHPLLVGVLAAVVLAAIMSTIDSLLVVAASAVVRDWYQKVRNPDMPDEALTGLARRVTFLLATAALGVALLVAYTTPERTVFWFVIFGWTGIAATFCPTILLSLLWRGMTTAGALAAMITGFLSVPLFKFVVYRIPGWGERLAPLEEMTPAFAISLTAGWLVSRVTKRTDP